MIKPGSQFTLSFLLIAFAFFFVFSSLTLELNALSIKQNNELIERIAKDFSKNFCNGVGFGLSQESAINIAMKKIWQYLKGKSDRKY